MNVYEVSFEPLYPVPSGFVLMAKNEAEALTFAIKYLSDKGMSIENVSVFELQFGAMKITGVDKPQVIFFESGDY